MNRWPRRGDRFIHMYLIRDGVRIADVIADPSNEEFYSVRIVTAVLKGTIYHAPDGHNKATHYFPAAKEKDHVLRWLQE